MKKALVCGGHGFIGHHLALDLKRKGYWVRTVDINDYVYGDLDVDDYVVADLRDPDVCMRVTRGPDGKPFDECYQLGAWMGGAGVVFLGSYDAQIMYDSGLINLNMAEACRKNRTEKIFYSSSACFVAGTQVFTDKGYIPIEDVRVGSKVIAEDGQWHKVVKLSKRKYSGKLCKIKVMGSNEIICTPDHRFLMEDRSWKEAHKIKDQMLYDIKPNLSDHKKIYLDTDYLVEAYKELKLFKGPLYLLAEKYGLSFSAPYHWARTKEYPLKVDPVTFNTVEKTYDLGKVIGLILSEGWYEKNGGSVRITCAFGKHETDLINEYKRCLNSSFGIPFERISCYNTRTALKVSVCSKRLVTVVSRLCDFKSGGHNKKITMFGMLGPVEYRRGILDGANLGDGSSQLRGTFNRYLWATTSKDLASQISILLKSLGKHNSICVGKEKDWNIEGRSGRARISYQVYTKVNNTKVQEVNSISVKNTDVYNLEVEDVHSYLVEGVIVHNCAYNHLLQVDSKNLGLKEEMAYPAFPDSVYGWEKLVSEQLWMAFARNYNMNVKIARFHNVMGEEGAWDNGKEKSPAAVCRKVARAEDGDTIDIWGDGEQTRSFLYIDECLEGIRRLMDSDFSGPVNIGSDEIISINNLVEMAKEIAGKPNIKINHIEGPLGVRGRTSDNTLIKEKLGWAPSRPLREGMEKLYKWIDEQVKNGCKDVK